MIEGCVGLLSSFALPCLLNWCVCRALIFDHAVVVRCAGSDFVSPCKGYGVVFFASNYRVARPIRSCHEVYVLCATRFTGVCLWSNFFQFVWYGLCLFHRGDLVVVSVVVVCSPGAFEIPSNVRVLVKCRLSQVVWFSDRSFWYQPPSYLVIHWWVEDVGVC